jgi:hypothetical protein
MSGPAATATSLTQPGEFVCSALLALFCFPYISAYTKSLAMQTRINL